MSAIVLVVLATSLAPHQTDVQSPECIKSVIANEVKQSSFLLLKARKTGLLRRFASRNDDLL
jgi:hypothetical protein